MSEEKFRAHSEQLNAQTWQAAEALGMVGPEDTVADVDSKEVFAELLRLAKLYDYMLAVARANGFNSITEAITLAVPRLPVAVQFEAPARRYTQNYHKIIGLWQDGVHVTVESAANEKSPLELGVRYKVTIERLP